MTKTIGLISIISFLFFGIFMVSESVVLRPFGGQIVTTAQPPVVCPGTGPISLRPVNIAPPTPYYKAPAIPASSHFATPGAWTLGLYNPIPTPVCWIPGLIPTPYPSFVITLFGSSTFIPGP